MRISKYGLGGLVTWATLFMASPLCLAFQLSGNPGGDGESNVAIDVQDPKEDVRSLPAGYSIPLLDLAGETQRQVIVDREDGQYLGHPTTVLLEDGKTMICVYPKGHGKGPIMMKRSQDGGKTWSPRLDVPENWSTSKETPTIHRVVDAAGKKRLVLFSGLYPIRMTYSEDDGQTWSALKPIGDFGGIVAMGCVQEVGPGRYMALFHDDGRFIANGSRKEADGFRFHVYKTVSQDGGMTWSAPEVIATHSQAHLCEPGIIRSPDGKQLAVLLRENSRKFNSFLITSEDEGLTWSTPQQVPASLTGDRHTAVYAEDGRLFISFRDTTRETATKGDWVAWVGTYDDLINGKDGQYRIRLMDNQDRFDCAYPGVEILPDDTIVTTTYGHWEQGQSPYIVSVRLKLNELDAMAKASDQSNESTGEPESVWSRFRGDTGTGYSPQTGFPARWKLSDFAWQAKLSGTGNGSAAIWGEQVFVQSADVSTGQQFVECLEAGSGSVRWKAEFGGQPHRTHAWGSLASATPVVDKDRIYICFGSPDQTVVCALDHAGKRLWIREFGKNVFAHGFGISPTLAFGRLIFFQSQQAEQLQSGQVAGQSRMLSLDVSSGETIWETPLKTTRVCYGVPVGVTLDGGRKAIVAANTGNGIFCLDWETGSLIWEKPVIAQRSVASPVIVGDLVLASSGSGGGGNQLVAMRLSDQQEVYRMTRNANYVPSPLVIGKLLFVPGDKGILSCLDLASGEVLNQKRIGGRFNISSSLVATTDRMFAVSDEGIVKVYSTDQELEELGAIDLQETTRATPAIGKGLILFRTDSKVYCLKAEN